MANNLHLARIQVIIIAVVCFLCPGMFNALNSLPTSGPSAQEVKDKQNAALYLCFAIMGLLAGGLNNILGPRILATIGGTGYAIYAAAQYNVFKAQNGDSKAPIPDSANAFSIFSGAYIGLCAGMLWAAQGQICLTYPTESQKGTFFATFWVIFNLGPPGTILREDLSKVDTPNTNVLREFVEILKLFANPAMMVMLIPCMTSCWYYTYQFGPFGDYFSGRTDGLKAIFYWTAEAAGSWILGALFLDNTKYPRRTRAWMGCSIITFCTLAIFGGGAAFEYELLRKTTRKLMQRKTLVALSVHCFSISNDTETLSRYAGFYKGTQSAGAGISWALNGFAFTAAKGNKFAAHGGTREARGTDPGAASGGDGAGWRRLGQFCGYQKPHLSTRTQFWTEGKSVMEEVDLKESGGDAKSDFLVSISNQ
ncbi:hypothetical protein BDR26DRAFT_938716 [Obelidium mucronatum]|nr:hypothetical protein BDR26DRAFT_938716 [Obelidium mucronatum]